MHDDRVSKVCVSCVIAFSNFPQPVLPSQYNFQSTQTASRIEKTLFCSLSTSPCEDPRPGCPARASRGTPSATQSRDSNMLRKDNRNTSCRGPSDRRGRLKSLLSAVRHRTRHKGGEMMYPLLFVSLLAALIPAPVSSSASLIDCTHATSHCTDCSALCAVAQFYPLLPPPCHPNSTVSFE